MDMQLILAARPGRVDGERDRLARHRAPEPRLDEAPAPPAVVKDRRRVGRQHLRVVDPGDPAGRDGEHLGDPDEVLEDRHALLHAPGEVDALARLRPPARLHVRHALAIDDPPEGIRVGVGWTADQGSEAGCGQKEGPDRWQTTERPWETGATFFSCEAIPKA